MLATALLAALTWDALFPDRTDQEIVGALPVRPRTLAGARLAAALSVGTVVRGRNQSAGGLHLQRRVIDTSTASGRFRACWPLTSIATMMACACTFLGLMSLRAIVVMCAGERVADRLALVLQFVTIVLLVETFLFLPSVLPNIIKAMLQDHASYAWAPPVWFTALFLWMAEGNSVLGQPRLQGRVGHRDGHRARRLSSACCRPPGWAGGSWKSVTRARERCGHAGSIDSRCLGAWAGRPKPVRVRCRQPRAESPPYDPTRHLSRDGDRVGVLKLFRRSSQLSGSLVLDAPRAYTLALPLVLMFFAVFGLRAAFSIPTELDANWVLRLVQPTVRESVRASRWLILMLGVVPIAIVWLLFTLAMWPAQSALGASLLILVTGMLLTELALSNWTKIPFASAHEPATETLKSRAAWYITALLMYQFILSELQIPRPAVVEDER